MRLARRALLLAPHPDVGHGFQAILAAARRHRLALDLAALTVAVGCLVAMSIVAAREDLDGIAIQPGNLPDAAAGTLARGEELAALHVLRAAGDSEPRVLLARAQLALRLGLPVEALGALERAAMVDPDILDHDAFAHAVVEAYASGRVARVAALVDRLPPAVAMARLEEATTHLNQRIRRGAVAALAARGVIPPRLFAAAVLDAWQADRCETRRMAVARALELRGTSPHAELSLQFLAEGDREGCATDLLAPPRGAQ